MERTGACMGCHRNMADDSFWTNEVIGKYGRMLTDDEHIEHMDHVLQDAVKGGGLSGSAWIYVIGSLILGAVVGAVVVWFLRKK
jgi:hypothetical protein